MNRTTGEPAMRVRRLGRAWLGSAFDYLLFLRPRQWPILTSQLAVGIFLAPACLAAWHGLAEAGIQPFTNRTLFVAWLVWVVCLNGGTLAFNSAYDQDTEDIAYLRRPPVPPPRLALYSLFLMLFGAGTAWSVSPHFALVTAACVVLSILYSHPSARWKSIPGLDLAVNMVGYGAGTTLAGLCAGNAAFSATLGRWPVLDESGWYLVSGFGLLFGSFYPLTQIYQIDEDRKRDDRTLSSSLGPQRSLILALVLGMAAAVCFLGAAAHWSRSTDLTIYLPLTFTLAVWLGHIVRWLIRASSMHSRDHEQGMYVALVLWAAVDLAVLLSRYLTPATSEF